MKIKTHIIFLGTIFFMIFPVVSFGQTSRTLSIEELQRQITALQQQIAALQNEQQGITAEEAVTVLPLSQQDESFDRDLYYGMRNDPDVSRLQRFLKDQRFYMGPITGNFFLLTKQAVQKFQSAYRLAPTGYFGPLTRAVANRILKNSGSTATAGSLSIVPSSVELKVGESIEIKAYYQPPEPACRRSQPACMLPTPAPQEVNAIFTSSDSAIAVISNAPPLPCNVPDYRPCQIFASFVRGIAPGKATITATYKDISGTIIMANANIIVYDAGIPSLTIITTLLPSGTINMSYTTSISASGGSDSYVWSIVSGSLPTGLNLHQPVCIAFPCQVPASIFGTPTTAGVYTFTVRIASGQETASQQFTITVADQQTGNLFIVPARLELKVGESVAIKAYYQPPEPACRRSQPACMLPTPAPQEVNAIFTSSNSSIAGIGLVGSGCATCTDVIYLVSGNSVGVAIITATYITTSGTLTATASVTVLAVSTINAPIITTHPSNQTINVGQTATFSVQASGTAPLSYQWQKNNINITGATNASYTTPPATTADNGSVYRVMVSNSAGSITSNTVTLTVNTVFTSIPAISVSSTSFTAGTRINVSVSNGPANPKDWVGMYAVGASNSPSLDWFYLNGSKDAPMMGQNSATLLFTATTSGIYNFRLFANDGYTLLAMSPNISVSPPPFQDPTLTFSASVASIQSGQSVILSWSTTNVTLCTASNGWLGTKAISGSQAVSPTVTTTYTLTCIGNGKTVSKDVVLTVTTNTWSSNQIKILSFNIQEGGQQSPSQTAAAILASGADVAGIQETVDDAHASAIAMFLPGWSYRLLSGGGPSIFTRHSIEISSSHGVRIRTSSGKEFYVYNVHLLAFPYEPYDIRDGKVTNEAQAVNSAYATRHDLISQTLAEAAPQLSAGKSVFLVCDCNEPSHLDWTATAASAGLHAFKVAWPASLAITQAGLKDSYRIIYPNEVTQPGFTWTPKPTANEVHDRIDFVYYAGSGVSVTDSRIIGEDSAHADIVVSSYPSDHRAVISTFSIVDSPMLSVFPTSISSGGHITVSVANAPGSPTDWVGMYAIGAPNSPSLDWFYLNGSKGAPITGRTSATLIFTAPANPGAYEFRLFANDGYTMLVKSSVITVQ